MYTIDLNWKDFSVNLDKVKASLTGTLSSNFDGLLCDPDFLHVVFKDTVSQEDIDATNSYWNSVTSETFAPTQEEILSIKLNQAIEFGNGLIVQVAIDNMALGITQAGKTREVADYLGSIQRYLQTGSLYAAMEAIDDLIAQGVPSDLDPFVTQDKMLANKTKIQDFINAPV